MVYTKTNFIDNQAPGMSASWANNLEDKIVELDTKAVRVYQDGCVLYDLGEIAVGGFDSNKNIVMVKLTLGRVDGSNVYRSPEYNLQLNASDSNLGCILVTALDAVDSTRYPLLYRFTIESNKKYLYVTVPSGLDGYSTYVDYYYAEQ